MLPTLPHPVDYEITEPERSAPHGWRAVLIAAAVGAFLAGFWFGTLV